MKIEMGESLFYSWLRHVKECQIVQTNWKTSSQWTLQHEDELENIMSMTDAFFQKKYKYSIYKKTASLSQFLRQAECDAIGICARDGINEIFAVDVAFHESGLNYGDRPKTVMKILAKSLRTAMCIYGYFDTKDAEIIFASPKINKGVMGDLIPCIVDMQEQMNQLGYHFRFRVIANEDFHDIVLEPILMVSHGVADTTELFLRSYQMMQMFDENGPGNGSIKNKYITGNTDAYAELKIGKLAQIVLRGILESGTVPEAEIMSLQGKKYSKKTLGINFPLLVKAVDAHADDFERIRYYKNPVIINGTAYFMCSQWAESSANNDRPYLLKWIEEHT